MEETDISQLSEAEIMDIYSNVIESGEQILIAKCSYGCSCAAHPPQSYSTRCVPCGTYCY